MQWNNSSAQTTSQGNALHNPHPSILIWLLVDWRKVVDQSTRVLHTKECEAEKQANARDAVPLETTQIIQLSAIMWNKDAVITTRGTSQVEVARIHSAPIPPIPQMSLGA